MDFAIDSAAPAKKLVLFHRDFQRFTGGHLKVWDYFNHVAASPAHEPCVAFSASSIWDSTNPWFASPDSRTEWKPENADILFLAGKDWQMLPESARSDFTKPIINLIQHPRHAERGSELRSFLRNRAVRICVSEEVAHAIKQTGEVNGSVFAIPNGIDLRDIPKPSTAPRKIDIVISALKAPDLASEVKTALAKQNCKIDIVTDWMPRVEYIARISEAKITVFLPRPAEGFYLPALEGMAAGTIVVCPDCEGNRGFCEDLVNCFRPEYDAAAIARAAIAATRQTTTEREQMLTQASATAEQHSLASERESFLSILPRIDELLRR
ncbi:MAG: glycosyltransferase [Spartobacteria bacterium]